MSPLAIRCIKNYYHDQLSQLWLEYFIQHGQLSVEGNSLQKLEFKNYF